MKKLIIFVCLIAFALTQDPPHAPPEPTKFTPTTAPTTPTTSTTPPPTTTPPSTTTTSKPTTTAITTEKPITTSPTTTTKPTTSPTSATTTPTPGPKKLDVLKFNITDSKNVTCILLSTAIKFQVPYETQTNGTHHAEIMIPKTAKATGMCGNKIQNITIQWSPDNTQNVDHFEIEFEKNDTKKTFHVSKISGVIQIDNVNFPNAKDNTSITFVHMNSEFKTPFSMSYKCDKEEFLNMTLPNNDNTTVAILVVSKLQIEAYRNSTTHTYSSAEDCEPFQVSGIVPIAVGCSLVALIIIVLVAYLIGRRRARTRDYLSMFTERHREEEYIPMKNLSCFGQ